MEKANLPFLKSGALCQIPNLGGMGQIFEARVCTHIPLIKRKCCSMLESLVQAYITTWHFFAYIGRNLANWSQSLIPVNTSQNKLCTPLPYTKTDLRHDSSIPKTCSYSESLFCCKTGQVLQLDLHNHIHSCVFAQACPNTFHIIHTNYPKP